MFLVKSDAAGHFKRLSRMGVRLSVSEEDELTSSLDDVSFSVSHVSPTNNSLGTLPFYY